MFILDSYAHLAVIMQHWHIKIFELSFKNIYWFCCRIEKKLLINSYDGRVIGFQLLRVFSLILSFLTNNIFPTNIFHHSTSFQPIISSHFFFWNPPIPHLPAKLPLVLCPQSILHPHSHLVSWLDHFRLTLLLFTWQCLSCYTEGVGNVVYTLHK